jgi:hypothetical protein
MFFFFQEKQVGMDIWQVQGRANVQMVFRWGNMRQRDHLEDLDVGGRIILKWNLK